MLPGLSRNGPQAKLTTDKPRVSVQVGHVQRYREYCIQQIRRGMSATSETMMIRQKATVPPIFRAVILKQFQDPLDPFTVEFMLRFVKVC